MIMTKMQAKALTYIQRATLSANTTARELLLIMEEKKSNLAVAVDVTTKEELLNLARALAPHLCVLKVHIDMITDFDLHLLLELQDIGKKERCIIFEDRKFADIGKTAKEQYEGGMYKIANWADLVTVHSIAGPGTVEALRRVGLRFGKGCLLLAEMSSFGSLAKGSYTQDTVEIAHQYSDFVIGFISQKRVSEEPYFIHMTPGVNLSTSNGAFGQQYRSPEEAIDRDGCDVIIVGSGIINATSPVEEAKKYQKSGWKAYEARVK